MRSKTIAGKLLEYEATPCYIMVRQLVQAMIEEARMRNYAAIEPEFYKNQGAISELKQVLKLLQTQQIRRGLDGAYSE